MSTLEITGNAHGQITKADVAVVATGKAPQFTDEGALKLVVQDANRAEMWLGEKQWALGWREADVLYQSPRTSTAWENGGATRANVQRFTVAKHQNTIVPSMMSGIFYDSPPFVIRPRGRKTTQDTCRAKSKVWGSLLEQIDFQQECEKGINSQVLKGTGVWIWGHYTERKIEKRFVRKAQRQTINVPLSGDQQIPTVESDEFEVKEIPVDRWCPFFEFCPLGTVLVAPGWRHANQVWKAPYVVHRQYLTYQQLLDLGQQAGYFNLDKETLESLCFPPVEVAVAPAGVEQMEQANTLVHHAEGRDQKTTDDPFGQVFKVDTRWDGTRALAVLQDKLVIRNEDHGLGTIPFLSANWWDIENAGYGMGIGRLIGSDQRVEAGALNAALDALALSINQQYLRSRGANVPTQQIRSRLGGIIDVDGDVNKAFKKLEGPTIPGELWMVIQNAKQAGESTTGADEPFMQGNLPGKGSSAARSATGAGAIAAASASRIAGPVGRFVNNVFIPFLVHLDAMINEHMPIRQVREILDDALTAAEMQAFDDEAFLNARIQVEVLAGAHLAAKKAMAQALPLLIQIFENPHLLSSLNAIGWTVDVKELFDMMMEMSEWKNTREVIRPMTPQEADTFKQNNAASSKQQHDLAMIQAKHEATAAEIDQKGEQSVAEKLLLSSADRATAFEERAAMEHAIAPRIPAGGEPGVFSTTGL